MDQTTCKGSQICFKGRFGAFWSTFGAEIWLPTGRSAVSWALSCRKGPRNPLEDPLVTEGRPKRRPKNPETALEPHLDLSAIYGCGCSSCGCNLRLSEVRSGFVWRRFGAGLGLFGPHTGPKSNKKDPCCP